MLVASGVLALVVGAAFTVLFFSITDLRVAEQRARQSEEVLVAANRFERIVVDAETGTRGFAITRQESFLDPWRAAQAALPEQAARLKQLVADGPDQLVRAQRINQAIVSYFKDYSDPIIDAARIDPTAIRSVPVTEEGKQRIDAIRGEFDTLVAAEQGLEVAWQNDSEVAAQRAVVTAAGGLIGSIVLILLFTGYLTRAIVRPVRRAAAMAGRLADGDLGARLAEHSPGEIGVLERSFNTMAGSLQESRAELAASRARLVTTADQARRRIERDLHDGIQQRLVSLALELRAAEAITPAGQTELRTQLGEIADGLAGATGELREFSRGIHPAVLSEGGLRPALRALARRSAVAVELTVEVPARPPDQVEVVAYYVVSEALANAAKHADASVVRVEVRTQDAHLHVSVRDDGIGGATPAKGSGLIGLTDRVQALGGTISITSPAGEGTTVVAVLPAR
ncbi:CHASE3 domain-containing protein [Amycolatopsis sp.]|jgi:signal transduction histidine kinase|uniref:sensor histidine kinase n=1 Tax=Amycolatopsis sp. TaxID=37632 RepID=UPI002E07FFBF|nr:CHASE3 domain-containing protein [Amycolatopsis sp.]